MEVLPAAESIRGVVPSLPLRKDRTLVLGGSGFIGSEIVREALEHGMPVAVLDRNRVIDPSRPWMEDVHWFVGSTGDEALVERAMEGVGWVVDAVGCPPPAASSTDSNGVLARTVHTLTALLDLLRQRPGVGLTFLSSGGTVYGNTEGVPVTEHHRCAPISPYGVTKLLAEEHIRNYSTRYGVPARILRVSNAYGPQQSASNGQGLVAACFEAAISDRRVAVFGDGRAVRDYVEVSEVAAAAIQLPPTLGELQTVNVGSSVGYQVGEVIALVERATGLPLDVHRSPQRDIDVGSIVLDTTRLRSLIRWEPRPLDQGIASAWEHWHSVAAVMAQPEPA